MSTPALNLLHFSVCFQYVHSGAESVALLTLLPVANISAPALDVLHFSVFCQYVRTSARPFVLLSLLSPVVSMSQIAYVKCSTKLRPAAVRHLPNPVFGRNQRNNLMTGAWSLMPDRDSGVKSYRILVMLHELKTNARAQVYDYFWWYSFIASQR
ncbi:hypothetical protein RRG08_049912 [Elysia crispata]|uniref:Uncharacterized protein n=1 Tax=Elysia crispata TaxID=231223 RepID=A0AAE1CPR7_9GAST|nr:hypothetical protein RRG08_049912 [Elysia crispata]